MPDDRQQVLEGGIGQDSARPSHVGFEVNDQRSAAARRAISAGTPAGGPTMTMDPCLASSRPNSNPCFESSVEIRSRSAAFPFWLGARARGALKPPNSSPAKFCREQLPQK